MPTPVRDQQVSFAGGLNTVSDPLAIGDTQYRRGTNARHTEYGALTKRYGNVSLATAALSSAPLSGYSWLKANGTVQALAACADGHLYGLNPLTTIGSQTWSQLTSSPAPLSTTVPATFAEFLDTAGNEVVFMADGGLSMWDGSTFTDKTNYGDASGVRYIKVHNQRLWGTGDPSRPASLFYSTLNDGETLADGAAGGGEIIVRTFGDEKLVGLASCNSSLLMFHERGLSRLTGFGQDDISVDPEGISSQTGTIAPLSIVEADGTVFFISDRGAFIANEGAVTPLGTPTRPDPILPLVAGLTPAQLANVRGVLSRKTQEVWFFIPGQGVYVYHLILGAWSGPWTGEYLNTACFWDSPVASYAEIYVLTGLSTGVVRVSDVAGVGTDGGTLSLPGSGTAITWDVQLRRLYFANETVAKSFRYAYVTANLGANVPLVLTWDTNFDQYLPQTVTGAEVGVWPTNPLLPTARRWGNGRWGSGAESQNYRAYLSGMGYYFNLVLTHTGSDTPIVSRVQVDAFILGRR